jgi:hypothetical protein
MEFKKGDVLFFPQSEAVIAVVEEIYDGSYGLDFGDDGFCILLAESVESFALKIGEEGQLYESNTNF